MSSFLIGSSTEAGFTESRLNAAISISYIIEEQQFVPFGRGALNKLNSVKVAASGKAGPSAFPEDKIVIPVGVTFATLGKYNFYQLLGFESDWADSADIEAIRKAYHKACLQYHPDKAGASRTASEAEGDRQVFLKIQDAFNTLSNVERRRAYDSLLPFDESIPKEEYVDRSMAKKTEKFFKIFDPVFKRNARFAMVKPVPEIGNMETPMPEVYKFYEYWTRFESWRDYSKSESLEHNIDDATCREEKRWMQKENERITKKLKTQEIGRIMDLVMLSQNKDPRIVADKALRQKAKDEEKNAKEADMKKRMEEDAAALALIEKEQAEAEERRASSKVDREKMKKLHSKARNISRKLLRHTAALGHGKGEYGILSFDETEFLLGACEYDDLMTLNDALGGEPASKDIAAFKADCIPLIPERLQAVKDKQARDLEQEKNAKEEEKKRKDEEAKAGSSGNSDKKKSGERDWNRDYLSMLAKAVSKFPAGLPNRWEVIATFMNEQLKPSMQFTQDECVKVALSVAKNQVPKPK